VKRGLTAAALALATQLLCGGDAYRFDLPKGFSKPRVPAANPMSEAKVRLGRHLFYDQRMSVNGLQSCATCHKQELAFTDGRAASLGATGQSHSRSAMSLVNVAFSSVLTWSNPNPQSLEEQALIPMLSDHPVELGLRGREGEMLRLFRADPVYRVLFVQAFTDSRDPFTISNIAKALASFERTIISAGSPYDRYYSGGDPDAISDSAKRGEAIFFGDPTAGCFRCHGGFNFSDAQFHNTGLYVTYPAPNLGIYEYTKKLADVGKFRAPGLRNIALTAPYMHDGSIATLEEVLDHYAAGGRGSGNLTKDPRMRRIALTAQNRVDLLAFLRSLTDTTVTCDPRFSNPW
jgi:cytochrome c peroxidase